MNVVVNHASYECRPLLSIFRTTDQEPLTKQTWEQLYLQAQKSKVPFLAIATIVTADKGTGKYKCRSYEGVALFKHLHAHKGVINGERALKVTYAFLNCFRPCKGVGGKPTIQIEKVPLSKHFPLVSSSTSRRFCYLQTEYAPLSLFQPVIMDALNLFVKEEKAQEHIGKCQFLVAKGLMKYDIQKGLVWMWCAAQRGISIAQLYLGYKGLGNDTRMSPNKKLATLWLKRAAPQEKLASDILKDEFKIEK